MRHSSGVQRVGLRIDRFGRGIRCCSPLSEAKRRDRGRKGRERSEQIGPFLLRSLWKSLPSRGQGSWWPYTTGAEKRNGRRRSGRRRWVKRWADVMGSLGERSERRGGRTALSDHLIAWGNCVGVGSQVPGEQGGEKTWGCGNAGRWRRREGEMRRLGEEATRRRGDEETRRRGEGFGGFLLFSQRHRRARVLHLARAMRGAAPCGPHQTRARTPPAALSPTKASRLASRPAQPRPPTATPSSRCTRIPRAVWISIPQQTALAPARYAIHAPQTA